MFRPAPSSRLLNLTGFFSGRGFAATTDIVGRIVYFGALTKGIGCFVAKKGGCRFVGLVRNQLMR